MTCHHITLANGTRIIACSRGPKKRCKCGKPATLLCDYPLRGKKEGKTCNAPMCRSCAVTFGMRGEDTIDYCRAHAELAAKEGEAKP